jgi:hypothetical protein
MKKQKTLTVDEYIDGRNDIINSQKDYDTNTEKLAKKEHLRVINIKIAKNTTKKDIPNTIPLSKLMKPVRELIKEVGDINKCKFILNPKYKEEYEKIIKEVSENHAKQNGITLVDFIFYDTIYGEKQYYEGFARGLDDLTLSEVGLKPLNMTEAQKKKLIRKVINKTDKEWHLKKI